MAIREPINGASDVLKLQTQLESFGLGLGLKRLASAGLGLQQEEPTAKKRRTSLFADYRTSHK